MVPIPKEEKHGSIRMEKGKHYPIRVAFASLKGTQPRLHIQWSWNGNDPIEVGAEFLRHSHWQVHLNEVLLNTGLAAGHHAIGFRVDQAPMPETTPWEVGDHHRSRATHQSTHQRSVTR